MSIPFPLRRIAIASVATLCFGTAGVASAQATFFDKPPSPDQLRDALRRTTPQAAPALAAADQPTSRGIVWEQPGTQANQQTQQAIAAEPPRATAQPAPQGGPAPAAAFPINFDVGSEKVAPASMAYVDAIGAVMVRDPGMKLVIEGHTDVTGSYQRNMLLSWDCAYSVFKVLVERYGIDPVRLQPVGRGPLEPMPGVAPSGGMNRRVQFRIDG
jgi:outer membrane protein OmpA-like peptidoglycan-associated protein